nr:BF3164 family lipoprotein [Labilibaculum sp. DW002]
MGHDKDLFGDPTNLRISDSLLFVLDPDSRNFIKLISLNNLSLIKDLCLKGRGPEEYGMICRFELLEPRKIGFYDDLNTTYYEADIKSNQYNLKTTLNRNLKIEKERVANTVRVNDCFVSSGLFQNKGRLLISSMDSIGLCEYVDDYPIDDYPKMSTMNKGMAYQTHFTNSINGYFTGYTLASGEIFFYSKNGNGIVTENAYQLFTPNFTPNSNFGYGVVFAKESCTGFLDVVSKDDFIYALYSGRTRKEFGMEAYMGNKIFIFTHSGVPVEYYELDVDIRTFDVDENGTIYALTINPYPQLVKFPTK